MPNVGEQPNIAGFQTAIDHYHELARQNPYDVRILTNLAWSYERAGEYPQAIQQFRKAVELDPTYTDAQYGLGLALIGNNQHEEALAAFEASAQMAKQSEDRSYMVTVQHHVEVMQRRYGSAV